MSDLREKLAVALYGFVEEIVEAELLQCEKDCLEETEQLAGQLNEAALEALNWKARAEQNASEWEEANQLLEQTIEVLEAAPEVDNAGRECCEDCDWWLDKAKPLLDNLKALKKKATE